MKKHSTFNDKNPLGSINLRCSNYWKTRLEGFQPERYFDLSNADEINNAPQVAICGISVTKKLSLKLEKLAESSKAKSLTLQTVLTILAHKYAVQEDICTFTFLDDSNEDLEQSIQPFRLTIHEDSCFRELLSQSKEHWIGDLKHAKCNVIEIADSIGIDFRNNPKIGLLLEETETSYVNKESEFELLFTFQDFNFLEFKIHYNASQYNQETISILGTHFLGLLESLLDNVDLPIKDIEFLKKREIQKLLYGFNKTKVALPKNKTVVTLFEEMASKYPKRIALKYRDAQYTYEQLNNEANRIANYLVSLSIGTDDLVPMLMDRSDRFLINVLAIWKSGAAYIPLDTDYPNDRISHIVEISEAKLMIVDSDILGGQRKSQLENMKITLIDAHVDTSNFKIDNLNLSIGQNDLSYVIFTSGSTGKPKGVMIEHLGMLNHLFAKVNTLKISKNSKVAQNASQCFDISVWQMFSALLVGGKTVIYDNDQVLDPINLIHEISVEKITIFEVVPSYLSLLLNYENKKQIKSGRYKSLKFMLVTGEALPPNVANLWLKMHPEIPLINAYGPTEASDDITHYKVDKMHTNAIPIGKTLQNLTIYILDAEDQLCGIGRKGELCVSGVGVGRGYLKDPDKTKASFAEDPFQKGVRMYRTGDLARFLPDGNVEFIGRTDHQIKLNGYRIELGEIENVMCFYPKVNNAVVLVKIVSGGPQLVCYYTAENSIPEEDLLTYLSKKLPDYMIPRYFEILDEFPLTPNGKLDRKSLPDPSMKINENKVLPKNELEKQIAGIWSEILGLEVSDLGVYSDFFKLGGDSLKLIQLNTSIKKELDIKIPIAELFRHTTIDGIVRYIQIHFFQNSSSEEKEEHKKTNHNIGINHKDDKKSNEKGMGIAVIGMAGKFPGAKNINEFWKNLSEGISSIYKISEDEMRAEGIQEELFKSDNYVPFNAYLEDKEDFDSNFFGYRPDEARFMDPQVRMFHEVCYHALEDAGVVTDESENRVGLFAGTTSNLNWQNFVMLENQEKNLLDSYSAYLLMNINYMCTRVSHLLNLKGPSVFLNTACSTSLVSIQRACQSLLSGECELALAGGITINNYSKEGYLYEEGMIKSSDGICRPFDINANGTVIGEGAGMVVLKPLEKAKRDGDQIYAVIRGAAVNNDGSDKVSYSAPSVDGQIKVITEALSIANVKPTTIGFVETHGTGTKLGDPIEVQALQQVFGATDTPYCALGAVKSNVGHCDAAAGVAGFIKAVYSLKSKQIPPLVNYEEANPNIDFTNSPFYINKKLRKWEKNKLPLRAGVSSFGIGGTNAHVIIEEAPEMIQTSQGRDSQLLSFSGNSISALKRNITAFTEILSDQDQDHFKNMAYTLKVGRKEMDYRKTFVCSSALVAKKMLASFTGYNAIKPLMKKNKKEVVFMFSGQGAQFSNMCLGLYTSEPFFKEQIDTYLSYLEVELKFELRSILFPESTSENYKSLINNTIYTQPALFVVEYALANLLMHWNISPQIVIGHSIGEYVAACVAGVFTWEEGLQIVVSRAKLMESMPKGGMLSVMASASQIEPLLQLSPNISLAAENSSDYIVVSGSLDEIEKFKSLCSEHDLESVDIKTSHAFHSSMMDEMLDAFKKEIEHIEFKKPTMAVISNVTGKLAEGNDLITPDYWARHLRNTVLFSKGLNEILINDNIVLIEVGPGRSLTTFTNKHHKKNDSHKAINMLRHVKEEIDDQEYLLKKLGVLWENDVNPSWKNFYKDETRLKVSLPGYAFEKTKYPVLVDAYKMIMKLSTKTNMPYKNWFYAPSWKLIPSLETYSVSEKTKNACTLILCDESGVGEKLFDTFVKNQVEAIKIKKGNSFEAESTFSYYLDPSNSKDLDTLFIQLNELGIVPDRIVNIWGIPYDSKVKVNDDENCKNYFDFISFLKAFNSHFDLAEKNVVLLSKNLWSIMKPQTLASSQVLESGLMKVLPQEFAGVTACHIDLNKDDLEKTSYADMLYAEVTDSEKGKVVALRDRFRWARIYDEVTPKEKKNNFRVNGTYLITGGLGDLGYCISEYLLSTYKANLIVTGTSYLPEKEDRMTFLAEEKATAKVRSRLERLKALEALDGKVVYASVAASDKKKMREVINSFEAEVGTINGLIHAAGIVIGESGMIPINTLEEANLYQQMEPKIQGLRALASIFEDRKLDFCIVTSTLSTVLGGMGYSAYVSANMYMDYFIESLNSDLIGNKKWLSLCLDGLSLDGTIADEINSQELIDIVEEVLQHKIYSQLLVSKTDLTTRLDKWIRFKQDDDNLDGLSKEIEYLSDEAFDQFEDCNESEKKLLRIWMEFFGNPNITTESDFFEIGGDSLKALSLVGRINNEFERSVTISDFFQNASITELGAFLNNQNTHANGDENQKEVTQEFIF